MDLKDWPPRGNSPTSIKIKKAEVVDQIISLIRSLPLSAEQVRGIYDAVRDRMVSKTCYKCGKLKLEIAGAQVWPDGDMSKPKRFVCGDCK